MKKKLCAVIAAAACALGFASFLTACQSDSGHSHKYEETGRIEPTCTLAGVKYMQCECGDTSFVAISALGHKYKETDDENAPKSVMCLRCWRLDASSEAVSDTAALKFGVIYEKDKPVALTVDGVDDGFEGEYVKIPEEHTVTLEVDGDSVSKKLPVREINENAFKGSNIKSVHIHDKVKTVGAGAFSDCSNLKAVSVPSAGLDYVGGGAFEGCAALLKTAYGNGQYLGSDGNEYALCIGAESGAAEFSAHANTKTIADKAFYGNSALKDVKISRDIKIGADAFTDAAIESAEVHALVTPYIPKTNLKTAIVVAGNKLPDNAFAGGAQLRVLKIAGSITLYGTDAFDGCDGITEIAAPSYALSRISKASLEKAEVVRGVRLAGESEKHPETQSGNKLPANAFKDCVNLKEVELHDRIAVIGENSFKNCSSIAAIDLPTGVTKIGEHAFDGCSSLAAVRLAKEVAEMGEHAFYGCENIIEVVYDGNIIDWGAIEFKDDYSRPTRYGAKLRYKGISESMR